MLKHSAWSLSNDMEASAVATTGSFGRHHCRSEWAERAAGSGGECGSGLGGGGCDSPGRGLPGWGTVW